MASRARSKSAFTADDWTALRNEVIEYFTPGTPINEADLFAGRQATIRQLQDTVLELGRHGIIFGERGVGKTSIANIFHRDLNTKTRHLHVIRVNADSNDTFDSLWRKVFRRIKRGNGDGVVWSDQTHPDLITPDDVQIELGDFLPHSTPVIIIDEFDIITDDHCRTLFTDAVKSLSDHSVPCTVIVVGVAESIVELLKEHASITRALVQVPMQRMSANEIRDVIEIRVKRLRMSIEPEALWRLSFFAAGLPYYAHLMGKHAVLQAIEQRNQKITIKHVQAAMIASLNEVDYSVRDAYAQATRRAYRNENIYPHVLAAAALTEHDGVGRFGAADVAEPLSAIMGQTYKTPSFSFHIKEMCEGERGPVFKKWEFKKTFRFAFIEPLMKPYIIMKSLTDGLLTEDIVNKFTARRQTELSIWMPQPSSQSGSSSQAIASGRGRRRRADPSQPPQT
jgi:Cdc6-like AAA superfamily ATPase